MLKKIKNFYNKNFALRYNTRFAMELYSDNVDFFGKKLMKFYGDFSKGLYREGIFGFDENGVFVFYDNNNKSIKYYNPCGIAEYALVCWANMLDDKPNYLKHETAFNNQIIWLINNCEIIENDKAVWYYNYPNIKKAFSGISQGMIISALLRAYQLEDNEDYFHLAIKSYNFLNTNVDDGGVLATKQPFDWWYEEYLDAPKILNGHIYALLGIWDLYRVTNDFNVKQSFEKGVLAIKKNINKFDLGFFTKYDAINPFPANNSYHYTHITLFKILYAITQDKFFNKYADKFLKYHIKFRYKIINFIYLLIITIFNKPSKDAK